MKLDWITFWICGLATYRLTVLITRDAVFKKLRGIDRCSKLLKCPFCVSIYMGAAVSVALALSGYTLPLPMWFCLSLAFSAVAIAIDRTFSADYIA